MSRRYSNREIPFSPLPDLFPRHPTYWREREANTRQLGLSCASLVEFVQASSPRARFDGLTLKSRGRVNGGRHIGGCAIKTGGVETIERACAGN